jgi:hypothetical protein
MKNKYLKKTVICVLVCLFSKQYAIAQVGIGTTNPDVTSILDIQSSNKGLLIPRMTKNRKGQYYACSSITNLQHYR